MGLHQPPKYRKLNKDTNQWEWFTPEPVDLSKERGKMKAIEVREKPLKFKGIKKKKS